VRAVEASLAAWVEAGIESAEDDADGSLTRDGSWTSEELDRADELEAEKYRADDWVRNRSGSRR
jgi:lipoate-protein ligase A